MLPVFSDLGKESRNLLFKQHDYAMRFRARTRTPSGLTLQANVHEATHNGHADNLGIGYENKSIRGSLKLRTAGTLDVKGAVHDPRFTPFGCRVAGGWRMRLASQMHRCGGSSFVQGRSASLQLAADLDGDEKSAAVVIAVAPTMSVGVRAIQHESFSSGFTAEPALQYRDERCCVLAAKTRTGALLSYFHKVAPWCSLGAQMTGSLHGDKVLETGFELRAMDKGDPRLDFSFKAKANTNQQVAIATSMAVASDVPFRFGTAVRVAGPSSAHALMCGASLEFGDT